MIGILLDSVLMLLLVGALAYGVRLEKKLVALREGQLAFAGAVTELNAAAGRAENALASLRASGEEADMLHDRILKARAVKQELDVLIARAPSRGAVIEAAPAQAMNIREIAADTAPRTSDDDGRALRMAALAERIQGLSPSLSTRPSRPENAPKNPVSAILGVLTANQAAQQSLSRARRSMDEDLFAA